jgi:hypothetical protein
MPEDMPPEPEKKKNLLSSWKGLAGWQKAGVLIGGAALAFAIYSYVNGQSAPTATGNDGFAGQPNEMAPGFGDQFPSVPVPPVPVTKPPLAKPPAPVTRKPSAPVTRKPPAPVARKPAPVARKPAPPKRSIILQPPLGGPRGRL